MSAILSPCGRYRYTLERAISVFGNGLVLWVMLNPSTADATVNDPTIVRVIRFSERLGFARAAVVNLFALRATDPRHLRLVGDPIGPENDAHIQRMASAADMVILGYGADPMATDRASSVRALLAGRKLHCLGKTKDGAPRHPLYLRANADLIEHGADGNGESGE